MDDDDFPLLIVENVRLSHNFYSSACMTVVHNTSSEECSQS